MAKKKIDTTSQKFKQSLIKQPEKVVKYIKDGTIQDLTKRPVFNADGWENIYTGLGRQYDKSIHTTFSGYVTLDDATLAQLWVGDGFGNMLVSIPADDMTREWIKIINDTDGIILTELEKLDAESHTNLALKWRALFGGGINVLGVNDGRRLEEPVNLGTIKSIDWIRTYDRTDISITEFHFNSNPEDKNFGEVEYLTIMPVRGVPYNVHIDRLLVYKGIPVPNRIESGNFWYWGMGELQSVWTQLKNLGAGFEHVVKILYEFVIGKYSIDGLADLVAQGNKKTIEDIVSVIELGKSTINAVLMDGKDNYMRDSINVVGLSDLLDRFMLVLSGVSGIPVTKLFGRSPAGMNATGQGDLINYYDKIKSKQKNIMKKNLFKLVNYINFSLGNPVKEPGIEFNSLVQEAEEQKVKNRKIQAETDGIYIEKQVLMPEEVTESRFGGDIYSSETNINETLVRGSEEEEIEEEEEEIEK